MGDRLGQFASLFRKTDIPKIASIYVLMIAGGLWHFFGIFQNIMSILSAPLLILITVLMTAEVWFILPSAKRQNASVSEFPKRPRQWQFALWSILIVIAGLGLEWFGINHSWLFGAYHYKPTLQPQIDRVPLAIGFAWLGILLSAGGFAQWLLQRQNSKSFFAQAFLTALLMTAFDAMMEPAAVRLQYWIWQSSTIPMRNYLIWYLAGQIFSLSFLLLGLYSIPLPRLLRHAFTAQLLYFLLVNLKP
jgi:uncharacterized membrane protein